MHIYKYIYIYIQSLLFAGDQNREGGVGWGWGWDDNDPRLRMAPPKTGKYLRAVCCANAIRPNTSKFKFSLLQHYTESLG